MQMCHSLRCKQIDMLMVNQLILTFPNNAECSILLFIERVSINCRRSSTCTCNRESKLVERLKVRLWTVNARSLLKMCTHQSSTLKGGL